MNEPEFPSPAAPSPAAALAPQAIGPLRRFFRDIESSGNLEDGMEFHAAGVVIGLFPESDSAEAEMSVLYLNPFTASVERRARTMGTVILYEFPPDDGVYWRLWEQTRAKLESLRTDP